LEIGLYFMEICTGLEEGDNAWFSWLQDLLSLIARTGRDEHEWWTMTDQGVNIYSRSLTMPLKKIIFLKLFFFWVAGGLVSHRQQFF
jgi:hypothetical protein